MIATVFCLARDEVRAMRVLDDLRAAAFPDERISVLLPEQASAGGFSAESATQNMPPPQAPLPREAAASDILEGLQHRTCLTSPEAGRLIGAGPLMLALYAPTAMQGGDDLASKLANAGIPAFRSEFYQQRLAEGKILVAVQTSGLDETSRVQAILSRAGADDILVRAETSSDDSGCGAMTLRHAA